MCHQRGVYLRGDDSSCGEAVGSRLTLFYAVSKGVFSEVGSFLSIKVLLSIKVPKYAM